MKFGVIADDLSGGMNIGAEFAAAGLKTMLVQDDFLGEVEVLILDTETRNLTPDAAYARAYHAAQRLQQHAPEAVIKKIDSLLRGSIGQEIEAVQAVFGHPKCLLIAASPKINRHTLGGYQYIEKHLLEMVITQVDPSSTVVGSNVLTILGEQTRLPISLIGLDTLYEGSESIRRAITESSAAILVSDCGEQADLNRVVEAAYAAGVRFFAGTYGLGEALSRLFTARAQPVLVVVGSLSAAAYQQVQYVKNELDCQHVQLRYNEELLDGDISDLAAQYRLELDTALDSSGCVILQVSGFPDQIEWLWQQAADRGLNRTAVAERLDQLLGQLLTPLPTNLAGVVATGGATANRVFSLLNAAALRVDVREVLPGTPGARIIGGPYDGLPFIAKPGSQGSDAALAQLVRYIREINLERNA